MEQANVVVSCSMRGWSKICTFEGKGCNWRNYRMFQVVKPQKLIELQEKHSYFVSPVEFFLVKGKTKW